MLTKDKIQGCYWGFALGDAMGMPVEFNQIDVIREKYGEQGILEPKPWAIWTDDTEMTLAVSRALLKMGKPDQIAKLTDKEIGTIFGEEFIKWFDNMGHAPGITCKTEVFKLRSRGPENWNEVGKNDSKGCGTAMRSAPLGLWFADVLKEEIKARKGKNHDLLAKMSQIQSEMTHGHKAATAAALASSYAVSLCINQVPICKLLEPIEQYTGLIHSDFQSNLKKLKEALRFREKGDFTTDLEAIHYVGRGWVGDEAFCMALYAAIRAPNNLQKCLQIAVNHSGDSDSVGCISGSILGAYHGMKIIPERWINRLAEKQRMYELIQKVETLLF
ncbi:MAG: ADP-ribosylglycohydrolase family protein [Promethearchaeota archaeon]